VKAKGKEQEIIMTQAAQTAYKDLQVWQKSMSLVTDVINLIENLETDRKHYRLIEQIEASATSIPMNIAEGKGRESKKEFIRFLYIARGSIYETLTLLEIFLRLGWISQELFSKLEQDSIEIIRMLKGLINALSRS
jgi:four helix bundle protein